MQYGRLTPKQKDALAPYVRSKVVWDVCAGNGWLSRWLHRQGAKVIAFDADCLRPRKTAKEIVWIERTIYYAARDILETGRTCSYGTRRNHGEITIEPRTPDVVTMSWPPFAGLDAHELVARTSCVVYLGQNDGEVMCGDRHLWGHLVGREILEHVRGSTNTLIVYGPLPVSRDYVWGEPIAKTYNHPTCWWSR